ncbi:MAG: hypothetical protein JSV85_06485 [Candidatus Bathyarchaeota archaeon]|nr:MAG: hypothetical protein JSV85_06485 [Candidatus Bathyarchaeota archaeon]
MRSQWIAKNVDLRILTERIKQFFPETDFETAVEGIQQGYLIRAASKIPNLRLKTTVRIQGRPNDFMVEFLAGGKRGYLSLSMIVGYLTTMFGGGYLISKEAQKQENLDMLENDFWKHVDLQVADLVDSSAHSQNQSKTATS